MSGMTTSNLHIPYDSFRIPEVQGRYFPPDLLEVLLHKIVPAEALSVLGYSVESRPIYQVRMGRGPVKIYMWSQMHGNESTTTKALIDLLSYVQKCTDGGFDPLKGLELCLIPMLNPDGARAYTRFNANGVDLNRDAATRREPESKLLRQVFDDFIPDFCFNLHDQRSIYGVGESGVSATLSFLAPAADPERRITPARQQAMQLIAGLVAALARRLPGGIGRYDDSFNADCVGDQFQLAGVPTVLFEAGHFPGDYQREKTRGFVFTALLEALRLIATGGYRNYSAESYLAIPENRKNFTDILIKHPGYLHRRYAAVAILALHLEERLQGGEVQWAPVEPEAGLTEGRYGHAVYDASREEDRAQIHAQPALSKLFS